jgi:hypothetical protein
VAAMIKGMMILMFMMITTVTDREIQRLTSKCPLSLPIVRILSLLLYSYTCHPYLLVLSFVFFCVHLLFYLVILLLLFPNFQTPTHS